MKAIIQRVLSAAVVVDGKEISRINKGLMCLIGIGTNDTPVDMEYIVKKILSLRLFPDGADEALSKQWAKSVVDIKGDVLCVSQFTLHASTRKGSKPDFHGAMSTAPSKEFYNSFLNRMRESYEADRIQDGEFGALMNVSLTNEGPVTIILDSKDTRSGGTSSNSNTASGTTSGTGTPNKSAARDTHNKTAEREAHLLQKQLKREETERRQRENAAKRAQQVPAEKKEAEVAQRDPDSKAETGMVGA